MSKPLIVVSDLRVHFARQASFFKHRPPIRAVDGVDLTIQRGEVLALVGESGSGKTTIGRAILRLGPSPTSGVIKLDGQDLVGLSQSQLRPLRRRMQMVFQDPYSSLDPRMSVRRILRQPLSIHGLTHRAGRDQRVSELLSLVGLRPEYANRLPHQFSGGQRQRIGIARALAVQPEFVVCDEPVSALDVSIRAQILNLLMDLKDQFELTYLFIGHDLGVIAHVSDRIAVMYLGKVVEMGNTSTVLRHPSHPYSKALISAAPVSKGGPKQERIILQGEIPSPVDPPSGCRFHTRCWLYESLGRPDVCRTDEPVLRERSGEVSVACHFPIEPRSSAGAGQ